MVLRIIMPFLYSTVDFVSDIKSGRYKSCKASIFKRIWLFRHARKRPAPLLFYGLRVLEPAFCSAVVRAIPYLL